MMAANGDIVKRDGELSIVEYLRVIFPEVCCGVVYSQRYLEPDASVFYGFIEDQDLVM